MKQNVQQNVQHTYYHSSNKELYLPLVKVADRAIYYLGDDI